MGQWAGVMVGLGVGAGDGVGEIGDVTKAASPGFGSFGKSIGP